jgi:TolA-binding protein
VKFLRPITVLAATAALFPAATSALAQRQQVSPEQRIDRLERQVNEMQRRVFPKGKPADTAGFADDPAATQASVMSLDQRLDALQRQMADMLRQTEENGNRLRSMEAGIGQLKADQDQRMQALEQRMNEAATAAPVASDAAPPATTAPPPKARPKPSSQPKAAEAAPPTTEGDALADAQPSDPGEEAYSQGFHQWEAGNYDQAIATLKGFVSAYPKHKRVSYANNLIGRSLLDKGDARAAATALLANYRSNPGGERAPDSLFYLGQALSQLGQTTQACKAYAELDAVYGAKVRPDLKKLESDARAKANCG